MPPPAVLAHALDPLRQDPARAAVLLDVDGTLAPIVERAEEAHVPEGTRGLLIELVRRYGLVACVSGRRAQEARQIVGIGSMAYVGNHGAELLAPGATEVRALDPAFASLGERVRECAHDAFTQRLRTLRVRLEDKGAISAFHWRGVPDEQMAESAVREVAEQATREGLAVHWGRKVLELRPPGELSKGRAVRLLLGGEDGDGGPFTSAVYAGDDRTDIDAFDALASLKEDGTIAYALRVAIASPEAPPELLERADLVLERPAAVHGLLAGLLEG
ncbi:MAG: trehalose-phosphatase [Acidobacteriota bacterium]|nr:trehalose-phosphatase [Acidobacteriota bacterium]